MIVKFLKPGTLFGLAYAVGQVGEISDELAKSLMQDVHAVFPATEEEKAEYLAQKAKDEAATPTTQGTQSVDIEAIKAQAKAEALAELKAEQATTAKAAK